MRYPAGLLLRVKSFDDALLSVKVQNLKSNIVRVSLLREADTYLNGIACWIRKLHGEPRRCFAITATLSFALLPIPQWIFTVQMSTYPCGDGRCCIARLTIVVFSNK